MSGSVPSPAAAATPAAAPAAQRLDPGLPGAGPRVGGPHPVPAMVRRITDAFRPLGFAAIELPVLAHERDNFDLLGYPADHPTRTQLTFSPAPGVVLRTHASSGTLPLLRRAAPGPVRALLIGTCFRNEKASAYSAPQFTQIDGVVVQPALGLPDLMGLAGVLVAAVFGPDHPWWPVRSHYPFTAPGFALEISCPLCTTGCEECQDRGRIEIGSLGLLSREVLTAGGYPADTTGLSFGCSVERLLRLSHGLTDIRALLANDPAVLAQFD